MTFTAGFDVGGTHARLAVFDETFQVTHRDRCSTRDIDSAADLADALKSMLDASPYTPAAIGVGLAAQLSAGGELVVNAPNLGWRDVKFADLLRETTQLPVRVVNDLNAAAWGEHVAGAARDHTDVLAVFVGTGVGGALILGGQLQEGAHGVAGEIGHCKVEVGGRLCGCGERGCIEAYVGGIHLESQVRALAARSQDPNFPDVSTLDLAAIDAACNRVESINTLWTTCAQFLAITVANACTLVNPGLLLLGGGILSNLPQLRQMALERIPGVVLKAARTNLEIEFGELGDDAGIIGAARLAANGGAV